MTELIKPQSLLQLAHVISQRVQIERLALASSQVQRDLSQDVPEEVRMESGLKVLSTRNPNGENIGVLVTMNLRGFPKEEDSSEDQAAVFQIRADFAVEYKLLSPVDFDDAQLDAFGKMNGVFNTWPYWREFVQSILCRMGLPAITLPVLQAAALEKMYQEQKKIEEVAEPATSSPAASG